MSLSRKRRRKEQQRQRHELHPAPVDGLRDREAQFSPEQLFAQRRALEESRGPTTEARAAEPSRSASPTADLQEARKVVRLAYTRRQAAEALGVSISTIDRRVVPLIRTVKTPWGQRLIPADELKRILREYSEPARGRAARRRAGRPATLPRNIIERIRLEYARGRGISEIARALNADAVPTAHDGRKWWPSTVRDVLSRGTRAT